MFFKELETDRLILRNISMEDRDFVFAVYSNNIVNRYMFDAEPLTDIQDADEIINFYIQPEPREQHRWVLVRKSDGVKLGTCGFHCWDKSKGCCDVGYELHPDFFGNGYMSEAMQEILDFARIKMEIKQIKACIYPQNRASINLAERFNFIYNGEMKDEIFRGQKYPHKIYICEDINFSIIYKDNILTADDYILFQRKMGWCEYPKEQIEKSLAHHLYSVVAIKDNEIIGMGRLISDTLYWYINDMFVLTEYQGKGIGRSIVNRLIQYVKDNSIRKTSASVYLFCAKDKEGFYEKLGFNSSLNYDAVGMVMDIDVG